MGSSAGGFFPAGLLLLIHNFSNNKNMPLARSIALNIIKGLVPLNLPGSQVIHYLQELHVTYQRTQMLADIRTAFDRIKYEPQVTALAGDRKIPTAWMSSEEFSSPFRYRVSLKVEYYNNATDEYKTEHRYMFSDEYLSRDDWADCFPEYAINADTYEEREIVGVSTIGVTRNTTPGFSG